MSLVALANHLASKGRGDDKMLVHMTPGEVQGLQALALAHGGSLTINPDTGLVEAGWLKKLLPAIAGAALNFLLPGVGTAIGAALGGLSGAVGTAIAVGGVTGLATGSLRQGIMAGLGAYGGASLASGLAGSAGAQGTAGALGVEGAATGAGSQAQMLATQNAGFGAEGLQKLAESASYAKGATPSLTPALTSGIQNLGSEAGRTAFTESVGGTAGLRRAALMAGAPAVAEAMEPPEAMKMRPMDPGNISRFSFDPFSQTFTRLGSQPAGMASGGIVALAAGGPSLPSDVATYTPEQKADLYNKFLSQGFSDAAIRQAAGQQTDADWQTLQQLAAQRGAPAVSGAERAVLTTPGWTSVGGQTGIAGLNQNIQNFLQQNPNISYQQAAAAAQQYGVDAEDIRRAVAAGGGSGGMQNVLTQEGWRSRTGLTGLEGMNKNIQMWLAENPTATEDQIRQAMQAVDINEADVMRATGKSVKDLAYKAPVPVVKPPVAPGGTGQDTVYGGDTTTPEYTPVTTTPTYGEPFQPTPQTMEQVRSAYEQGGGATRMPTITDIQPGERTYTQNAVADLLIGFLRANPNATYAEVTNFAKTKGIPEMQARAAYNEFRFSGLSGGSKSAYDFLMGRGAYPTIPFTPTGEVMRPYAESVLGMPVDTTKRKFIFDPAARKYVPNPNYVAPPTTGAPTTIGSGSRPPRDPMGNLYTGLAASYFAANPDVQKAFETEISGMSPEEYVRQHWTNFGKAEGRKGFIESQTAQPATPALPSGGDSNADIVPFNSGGITALADGGMSNLGSFSDGGRLLRGPGDGVSDSIPAVIGGRQPARLADGEFVIPARIVSELGNGSTEAGARKLYAMMDRVQRARSKTVGKGKVAKNTRADKHLPA